MDKAEVIREITNRMVGQDIDDMKLSQTKSMWYATFLRVSVILKHVEDLSDNGLITIKYKDDGKI